MNDTVNNVKGKVSAIAGLCLFSFMSPAQNIVIEIAPGLAAFTYGRDTLDTNAFPMFFRALGCDSLCALRRTADVLAHIHRHRSVEKLDRWLIEDLQGIGLKEYAWLRGWAIHCAEAREKYLYATPKRK